MGLMSAQPRYSDRAVLLDEEDDHQLDTGGDELDEELVVEQQHTEQQLSPSAAREGIDEEDDNARHHHQEQQRPRTQSRRDNPLGSVFGEVSIFRDFFLAAFSDGYNNMQCCGQEGFFPGSSCGFGRGPRVAPSAAAEYRPHDPSTLKHVSSQSSHESNNQAVAAAAAAARRRKKPLAVAVGFNYANDMNGRPIVVTPGCRRHPIDLTRNGGGASAAGAVSSACLVPSKQRHTTPPSPKKATISSPLSGDCHTELSAATTITTANQQTRMNPIVLQE